MSVYRPKGKDIYSKLSKHLSSWLISIGHCRMISTIWAIRRARTVGVGAARAISSLIGLACMSCNDSRETCERSSDNEVFNSYRLLTNAKTISSVINSSLEPMPYHSYGSDEPSGWGYSTNVVSSRLGPGGSGSRERAGFGGTRRSTILTMARLFVLSKVPKVPITGLILFCVCKRLRLPELGFIEDSHRKGKGCQGGSLSNEGINYPYRPEEEESSHITNNNNQASVMQLWIMIRTFIRETVKCRQPGCLIIPQVPPISRLTEDVLTTADGCLPSSFSYSRFFGARWCSTVQLMGSNMDASWQPHCFHNDAPMVVHGNLKTGVRVREDSRNDYRSWMMVVIDCVDATTHAVLLYDRTEEEELWLPWTSQWENIVYQKAPPYEPVILMTIDPLPHLQQKAGRVKCGDILYRSDMPLRMVS